MLNFLFFLERFARVYSRAREYARAIDMYSEDWEYGENYFEDKRKEEEFEFLQDVETIYRTSLLYGDQFDVPYSTYVGLEKSKRSKRKRDRNEETLYQRQTKKQKITEQLRERDLHYSILHEQTRVNREARALRELEAFVEEKQREESGLTDVGLKILRSRNEAKLRRQMKYLLNKK